MRKRSVTPGLLLAMALASPADAFTNCRTWTHLDAAQKHDYLHAEIERIVTSAEAKKYGSVNKVNMRKCLSRHVPEISDQFDGLCVDKKTASMQALNRELERYIWTCVGRRGS